MQTRKTFRESGNALICALVAILIVSLIGANVLSNSTTRLNVSSNQVRRSEEHTSELQSHSDLVCRLLLEKKKKKKKPDVQTQKSRRATSTARRITLDRILARL